MYALKTNSSRLFKTALLIAYSVAALALMGAFRAHAAGIPESVTGVKATAIDGTSIGLSWNAAKDSDGTAVKNYRLYYGTTSVQTAGTGEYGKTVDTPTSATSFVVSGLTANTTYYFALTAVNNGGTESELYSQEASAKTLATGLSGAAAPTAVPAPAPANPANSALMTATNPAPVDTTPAPATTTAAAPTVLSAEAVSKTKVRVVFSTAMKLPVTHPENTFTLTEQINTLAGLDVTAAMMDDEDLTASTVLLTTAEQKKDVSYVVTVGVTLTDSSGNPIRSGNQDSALFTGTDLAEESAILVDTTPPEDITGLLLSFKKQVDRFVVLMDWSASVNTAKDLMDQILYMSLDRGKTYGEGTSLGASVTHSEESNLEGGKEYTFKITTKDNSGNESVGAVKSIRLPQTGVGIGIFLIGSAALAGRVLRSKKKE